MICREGGLFTGINDGFDFYYFYITKRVTDEQRSFKRKREES